MGRPKRRRPRRKKRRRGKRKSGYNTETRYQRRERRRQRRKIRRRRFKRWLKKHYGGPHRRVCGHDCLYRHIRLRMIPNDMHWMPLSGLLPLFGTNMKYITHPFHPSHEHGRPKIHIGATVQLPHPRHDAALDYDLLRALLFNDEDKARKQGSTLMDKFDKKEKRIEKLITGQMSKDDLENGYKNDMDMEEKFENERTYKNWDEENDDRFEKKGTERRLINVMETYNLEYYPNDIYGNSGIYTNGNIHILSFTHGIFVVLIFGFILYMFWIMYRVRSYVYRFQKHNYRANDIYKDDNDCYKAKLFVNCLE